MAGGSCSTAPDLDDPGMFTAGFIAHFGGGTGRGAIASLLPGMSDGRTCFDIHTGTFPGGGIRGFLAVPEPAGLALAGLAGSSRRRR